MQKTGSLIYQRNNLSRSASPYLVQHAGNPVWWQEWTGDVVKYAAGMKKPLFVSVGYATCHWCHVMAAEAFSDDETAAYLNEKFICIKVDREQRPDIDQFMMDFINRQNGTGGWPLNVFLTPELHPVYALTYAPAGNDSGMHSFLSVAQRVYDFCEKNGEKIPEFTGIENRPPVIGENSLVRLLSDYYDPENGGFGNSHKFPPHSTLLFLLYQLSIDESPSIRTICTKTLDAMLLRGLNDHLQGGIFRYCVDTEWTIPHFEKMLYDQAMALWVFSLAFRITGREGYRRMSEKILRCLNESFEINGLYISAHDADTDHHEGSTYLWSLSQLKEALSPAEFSAFSDSYHITDHGNFDGANHLVRTNEKPLDEIEEKLLSIRKTRRQPLSDQKILCGINALTAVSMIHAARFLGNPSLEGKASQLVMNIRTRFWKDRSLGHSIYKEILQEQPFLFDAAALLTAVTLLYEEDDSWSAFMDELADYVVSFRHSDKWIESRTSDFPQVYASWFDHPIPSSVSLAGFGLARYEILKGRELHKEEYRQPFQSDFYNLNAMIHNGLFHIFTSNHFLQWSKIPVNSIQLRGKHEQDCYMGVCSPLTGHGPS